MTTLATIFAFLSATAAAPEPLASASAPAAPRFTLRMIGGAAHTGEIVEWTGTGPIRLRTTGGAIQAIDAAELLVLQTAPPDAAKGPPNSAASSAPAGHWEFHTTTGERFRGRVTGGDETGLTVRLPDGATVSIALELLRRVQTVNSASRDSAGREEPGEDVVELQNGDRATGLIDRVDADGISLQTGEQRRVLRWEVLAAARLANVAATDDPAGAAADSGPAGYRCTLSNGDLFLSSRLDWRGDTVLLTRTSGDSLRVDAAALTVVEAVGGRWQWLADLPPTQQRSRSILDLRWPMARNLNVAGGPLRCGGQVSAHGIGLHAAANVTWTLGGRYRRLTASAGIDDSGGPWSDASLTVRVDGRVLLNLEHLRHGEPPRPIDLDVSNGQVLELEIGFGEHGDVQDRVNLLDAGLIRGTGK